MKMPSKEQILEASKDCPDAKEVLTRLFPEAFKEEWVEITKQIVWNTKHDNEVDGGYLRGFYRGKHLLTASNSRFDISPLSPYWMKRNFKVEHRSGKHLVFERR